MSKTLELEAKLTRLAIEILHLQNPVEDGDESAWVETQALQKDYDTTKRDLQRLPENRCFKCNQWPDEGHKPGCALYEAPLNYDDTYDKDIPF